MNEYDPEIFTMLESEVNVLQRLLERKNPDHKYFEAIIKHWRMIADLYPREIDA